MHYVDDPDIRGCERPGPCNDWPVGQAPCDGRTVQAADRPTHFLGFPISRAKTMAQIGNAFAEAIAAINASKKRTTPTRNRRIAQPQTWHAA